MAEVTLHCQTWGWCIGLCACGGLLPVRVCRLCRLVWKLPLLSVRHFNAGLVSVGVVPAPAWISRMTRVIKVLA